MKLIVYFLILILLSGFVSATYIFENSDNEVITINTDIVEPLKNYKNKNCERFIEENKKNLPKPCKEPGFYKENSKIKLWLKRILDRLTE